VATQFEVGFLVGLLVGEGHFGGDGRQPQITLRMHVRHEAIFQWLERTFPGGRLYGPYHHDGRHYLQWMARGRFLRDELVPLLDRFLSPDLDRQSFERFQLMKARYRQLAGEPTSQPVRQRRVPPSDRRDATNSLLPNEALADQLAAEDSVDLAGAKQEGAPAPVPDDAAQADSNSGFPRSRNSSKAARDTDTFAELFAELRETWPS
jgi:hypothetical protein